MKVVPTIISSRTITLGAAPTGKPKVNKYFLLGSLFAVLSVGYLLYKKH